MAKRGQNEGSIRKRKDGSWEARVSVNGRRMSFYGKTRKEVSDKMTSRLNEVNVGKYVEPSKITFQQMHDKWKLFSLDADGTEETTKLLYRSLLKNHILPYFGDMFVQEIDDSVMQKFINTKTLAASTLRTIKVIMSSIFELAIKDGIIHLNPARSRSITLPKDKADSEKSHPITQQEFEMLIAEAEKKTLPFVKKKGKERPDKRWPMAIWLGATCGFRRGEVMGLMLDDIIDGVIYPTRACALVNGKGEIQGLKNHESYNPIYLTDEQVDRINNYTEWLAKEFPGAKYLFPSTQDSSHPVTPRQLTKVMSELVKTCGLDGVRFHDMRHTHGTQMMNAGIDSFTVQERLRHKDIRSTRRYVGPSMLRQKAAVEKLSNVVKNYSTSGRGKVGVNGIKKDTTENAL